MSQMSITKNDEKLEEKPHMKETIVEVLLHQEMTNETLPLEEKANENCPVHEISPKTLHDADKKNLSTKDRSSEKNEVRFSPYKKSPTRISKIKVVDSVRTSLPGYTKSSLEVSDCYYIGLQILASNNNKTVNVAPLKQKNDNGKVACIRGTRTLRVMDIVDHQINKNFM